MNGLNSFVFKFYPTEQRLVSPIKISILLVFLIKFILPYKAVYFSMCLYSLEITNLFEKLCFELVVWLCSLLAGLVPESSRQLRRRFASIMRWNFPFESWSIFAIRIGRKHYVHCHALWDAFFCDRSRSHIALGARPPLRCTYHLHSGSLVCFVGFFIYFLFNYSIFYLYIFLHCGVRAFPFFWFHFSPSFSSSRFPSRRKLLRAPAQPQRSTNIEFLIWNSQILYKSPSLYIYILPIIFSLSSRAYFSCSHLIYIIL